jgi:hypothetical protein
VSDPRDKLYENVSRVLTYQPVDDVIPVLITAIARCLVDWSEGDEGELQKAYARFSNLLCRQIEDMVDWDIAEASKATKQ